MLCCAGTRVTRLLPAAWHHTNSRVAAADVRLWIASTCRLCSRHMANVGNNSSVAYLLCAAAYSAAVQGSGWALRAS